MVSGPKVICLKPDQSRPKPSREVRKAAFYFMKSLIELNLNANFLITTSNWFIAPDGKSYRAVWGKVSIHSDEGTLGIKTNDKSSNWYLLVGDEQKRVVVAGCQVHYACTCQEPPITEPQKVKQLSPHQAKTYEDYFETNIYLAQ